MKRKESRDFGGGMAKKNCKSFSGEMKRKETEDMAAGWRGKTAKFVTAR